MAGRRRHLAVHNDCIQQVLGGPALAHPLHGHDRLLAAVEGSGEDFRSLERSLWQCHGPRRSVSLRAQRRLGNAPVAGLGSRSRPRRSGAWASIGLAAPIAHRDAGVVLRGRLGAQAGLLLLTRP